jgi:hypothetical protein
MAYEDCIREFRRATGSRLGEDQLTDLFTDMTTRAKRLQRELNMNPQQAFERARQELNDLTALAAQIEKRNRVLNLQKRVNRRNFYLGALDMVTPLTRYITPGVLVGLEAKLTGVSRLFPNARKSVQGAGNALKARWLEGMVSEFEREGVFRTVRNGDLDRVWARELFELNSGDSGRPGITGNQAALTIAKIVFNYQQQARLELNRQGAWVGNYQGFITRTSHDPDRIRDAGFEAWRDFMLGSDTGRPRLAERTFDGVDQREDFLRDAYNALTSGIHLTQEGLEGFKDPAFVGPGNLARKVSQSRKLHFVDADAWSDYHARFGQGSLIESVINGLRLSADNAALMREFGTNPKYEFEADLRWITQRYRNDEKVMSRMGRGLSSIEQRARHQFMQLDGTARMPVNRQGAAIGSGARALIAMGKLGAVVVSAITDVPNKAAELRFQGANLLEAYFDGVASLFRGRGSGQERDVADLLNVGFEGWLGDIAARFDGQDTTPGQLSKAQNLFFKMSGINYWTDAQRLGMSLMASRHLARQLDTPFDQLPGRLGPLLESYGIGRGEWELLGTVVMTQANGRRHVTPDRAFAIHSEDILAHLSAIDAAGLVPERLRGVTERLRQAATAEQREAAAQRFREDLSLALQSFYTDRSRYGILAADAKEFAKVQQGSQPGTVLGEAARLFMQFKSFPVAVVTKLLGRELYGYESRAHAAAGIIHMIVATTAFGYLAMTMKDFLKGRNPRDPTSGKTWAAALTQGGGLGIYADYLFGEYNRYGGGLETLGGPSISFIGDVLRLYGRATDGDDVSANAVRFAINNTPFINLFYVRPALDYLLLYQFQEALNPGFLRRYERRVEKENNQTFWLKPSESATLLGMR